MLQFDKSIPINSNAVYADVDLLQPLTSSILYLDFSQSYDNSNTAEVIGYLINNPGTNGNNFLVYQVSASALPTASGQYTVETYDVINTPGANYTWINASFKWNEDPDTWAELTNVKGALLSTDRAYVSGSDGSPITQYVSPDENGTYTTYNG